MTERNYVIVFDPLDPRFNRRAVKGGIKADPAISHWWNHVPNVFLVTAEHSARKLSAKLRPLAPGIGFFVMEVDPRNSDGWLADESWDWIKKREKEADATSLAS